MREREKILALKKLLQRHDAEHERHLQDLQKLAKRFANDEIGYQIEAEGCEKSIASDNEEFVREVRKIIS